MDILLGLQWGDEGKGKVVDFLAPHYDLIARFQGGPNAGHTLHFENTKHVLHQIPSGIFRDKLLNLIGNGVVLDPVIFNKELLALAAMGLQLQEKLVLSKKAQIILPTHRLLDAASELSKGDKKIGSTLKGISPAYQDKIGRAGLRIGDILQPDFATKYAKLKEKHLTLLEFYKFPLTGTLPNGLVYDLQLMETDFFAAIAAIAKLKLIDSEYLVNDYLKRGKKVLAEGAQGSLLDIDFGSYPFVTSSNTTVAGACTGLGVAPKKVGEVFGILKAYSTRVGGGPFPTELADETGEKLRKIGHEFGATTGRARRCGWLDLPALKYAVMLNGVTQLFMMKADVLNTFEEIKVCTHYKLPDGSLTEEMPFEITEVNIEPVYKTFKGWNCELANLTSFETLPQNLASYMKFVEQSLEVPITLLSYGSNRADTLVK
jgi:adenylosuccinate synthase